MSIKLTFRWYGKSDVILLKHIKQIPAMTGVVTAIYDIPVGKVWPLDTLQKLKEECNNAGLQMEVIESVPVHEDIKMGLESRDSNEQAQKLDIKNFWLPGWDDTYKGEERLKVIERYKKMGRETLFNNLVYFLNKVIPV